MATGEALTYVFPYEGLRYTAAEGETVLTQENLAQHADFLKAQGTTPDTVYASFAANQTVMEIFAPNAQLALSVAQTQEFRPDAGSARMDDARRAEFLDSFAASGLYESAAWSEDEDDYLRLTYSAMYGDVPMYFLRYVTLRHGQLYQYTLSVTGREIDRSDDAAVLSILGRIEYLGQLATPAPTPSPTPVPTPSPTPRPTPGAAAVVDEAEGVTLLVDPFDAWTDSADFTLTGTASAGASLTLSINGTSVARATAQKNGTYKFRTTLNKEGELEITVKATKKDEEPAHKSYLMTYEKPTLAIEMTEPTGYVDTKNVRLRGITAPGATVFVRGNGMNTNVKANKSGEFSISVPLEKEGDFTYTISAKLDNWHDGEIQFTLTRVFSTQEQIAAFRNSLSTIEYAKLASASEGLVGKNVSLRGRISAFSDYEGLPCLLLYTKNPGKGIWTEPVWILCDEILSFEMDNIKTFYATVEGITLPYTNEDGTSGEAPAVRMKFCVD